MTISSGTLQTGDTLNFTNQNGITGSYSGGVLTLSGTATVAQYQAALQSVTFSTTSTSTATRSLSIVALDNIAGSADAAAESVKVIAAPVVTAVGHDQHLHARRHGSGGRLGRDGNVLTTPT